MELPQGVVCRLDFPGGSAKRGSPGLMRDEIHGHPCAFL